MNKFKLSEIPIEKERKIIENYISEAKIQKKQEPLFIYGFPGSGKTFLIKQIITEEQLKSNSSTVCVYLNVLNCNTLDEIVNAILKAVGKETGKVYQKTGSEKVIYLKSVLKEKVLVLAIDEITESFTKIKGLFYNLVDYQASNTNLYCIFISNSKGFFIEKKAKIWSRAGGNKLHFESKKENEVNRLIAEDKEFAELFEEDSLNLVYKEMLNRGNDIRKLNHFVDYIYKEKIAMGIEGKISVEEVQKTFNLLFEGISGKQLGRISFYKKCVLSAFVYPNEGSISLSRSEEELHNRACRVVASLELPPDEMFHFSIFRSQVKELIASGILRGNTAYTGKMLIHITYSLLNAFASEMKDSDLDFVFKNFEKLKVKYDKNSH